MAKIHSGFNTTWFRTLRKCPECTEKLMSNGKRDFFCNSCGYKEEKVNMDAYYTRDFVVAVAEPGWHV